MNSIDEEMRSVLGEEDRQKPGAGEPEGKRCYISRMIIDVPSSISILLVIDAGDKCASYKGSQ